MIFYLAVQKILYLRPMRDVYEKQTFRQIRIYGVFNFFGGATGALIDKIDVLFIGAYLGLSETGIYAVALLLASTIALPAKALMQILYPVTADAFKNQNLSKIRELYRASSSNQLLIGAFILQIIYSNFDTFFGLVKPAFLLGKYPFLIVGIGRLFDMATGINGVLVINSRYYRYDLLFTAFLVVLTIITNNYLIPPYGMMGAAFATASSIVVYNVVKYFFVWNRLDMQPFTMETTKILGSVIAIALISYFLPTVFDASPLSGYKTGILIAGFPLSRFLWASLDIVYKSAVIAGLYFVSLLYFKYCRELYDLFLAIFRRLKTISSRR
jgi:O-antigen/teichoic acid export membrane protein